MNKFNHFNLGERKRIERYLRKGKSLRTIARILDRSVSSVSDEIKCNSTDGIYDAKKAHHKAYVRRKYAKYQGKKIVENADLKKEIDWRLLDGQSPKAIGGWLKRHMKKKRSFELMDRL